MRRWMITGTRVRNMLIPPYNRMVNSTAAHGIKGTRLRGVTRRDPNLDQHAHHQGKNQSSNNIPGQAPCRHAEISGRVPGHQKTEQQERESRAKRLLIKYCQSRRDNPCPGQSALDRDSARAYYSPILKKESTHYDETQHIRRVPIVGPVGLLRTGGLARHYAIR